MKWRKAIVSPPSWIGVNEVGLAQRVSEWCSCLFDRVRKERGGDGGGSRGHRHCVGEVVVVRMSWGVRPGMAAGGAWDGLAVAVVAVIVVHRVAVGLEWQRCLMWHVGQWTCLNLQVQ